MIDGAIITFADITPTKQKEEMLKKFVAVDTARKYAESIVETMHEPIILLDADLRVISANRSFYTIFKTTKEETIGRFIYDLGNQHWDIPELKKLLDEILLRNASFDNFEINFELPEIGQKRMFLNAHRVMSEGVNTQIILLTIRCRKVTENS